LVARFNERDWKALESHALHRDGDLCLACLAELGRDPGPLLSPTLDHLDGDKRNGRPSNIIRLCRPHNAAEGNRVRPAIKARKKARPADRDSLPPIWTSRIVNPVTYPGLRERAAEILRNRTEQQDLQKPSGARGEGRGEGGNAQPELVARWTPERHESDSDVERARILQDLMNPLYRLWVFEQVKEHGCITKADAIVSGAEHVDEETGRGAKKTILDYFDKISSRAGWLEEVRNAQGRLVWVFRDGRDITALETKLRGRVKTLRDLMAGGAA
jgi:hypothetical protein